MPIYLHEILGAGRRYEVFSTSDKALEFTP
jgi:hypothetical protein